MFVAFPYLGHLPFSSLGFRFAFTPSTAGSITVTGYLVARRQPRLSKLRARSRHVCAGDAGEDFNLTLAPRATTTSKSGFERPCRRRRSADCSGEACQLGRRRAITQTPGASTSKRRINDVMSQCIQAYCTDVLYHVRVACILRHCNRSRRAVVD